LIALEALLQQYIDVGSALVALLLGGLVFLDVQRVASFEAGMLRRPQEWLRIVGVGIIVSLAGYGIFFTVSAIQFTLAGISNRVAMSAAVGIAIVLVGAVGGIASRAPVSRHRPSLFAGLLAVLL
jgi:hypothetical protein